MRPTTLRCTARRWRCCTRRGLTSTRSLTEYSVTRPVLVRVLVLVWAEVLVLVWAEVRVLVWAEVLVLVWTEVLVVGPPAMDRRGRMRR